MRLRRRGNRVLLFGGALLALILAAIVLFRRTSLARGWSLPPDLYHDQQFAIWAGVVAQAAAAIATLLAVLLVLLLNTIRDNYRRPRFAVRCGPSPPFQVAPEPGSALHVRLLIHNVGRTSERECEVRVETIDTLPKDASKPPAPRHDHDPRPLSWVGRSTSPIHLSSGAFDLADLGVWQPENPENFRLDFSDRGHIDLNVAEANVRGFRIGGTVYGSRAEPRKFRFDLSWLPASDLEHIDIREV